jgi:hypothetical protein
MGGSKQGRRDHHGCCCADVPTQHGSLNCHTWLLLQDGWTPLHMAAQNGRLEVVGQLLGAAAAVDAAIYPVRPPVRHPYSGKNNCSRRVMAT